MRRFANCMNMLIFLFVFFEPLHSFGSEPEFKNYFNTYKNSPTFSSNDGRRDSSRFTATIENEQKGINDLIRHYFPPNVTASPRAVPSSNPGPRSLAQRSSGPSTFSKKIFDENITTTYYSTQVEDYPDFSKIAQKLRKFQGFTIKDVLPKPDLSTHTLIEPDSHQYRHLCRTEVEIITPRKIMNKANQPVKVVNYPEYEQSIHAETCGDKKGKEDIPCSFSENFPNNLVPVCKQNYIFRQLLVMTDDSDNPDVRLEDIPIPSCCECVLKDMTMQN